jgi:hypothetical protein
MAEIFTKLTPDRDLQCYFLEPSSIAALSEASANGFTVSGNWRQQFDWAVIEWNRDNVFEHPAFRYLPDGDLSGLVLSYQETRTNCVPIDSNLYPSVEWPYLRVWPDGALEPFFVPLLQYATAITGGYVQASATLQLSGMPTAGDAIGLTWLNEQYNYQVSSSDTIESAISALASVINDGQVGSSTVSAAASGAQITLTAKLPSNFLVSSQSTSNSSTGVVPQVPIVSASLGANWNRVGVYGFVAGATTESWAPWFAQFSGGISPTQWQITLPFNQLTDENGVAVPMNSVRKMRWTWAADLQAGEFQGCEFEVSITNWTVTGKKNVYSVAGPGSFRIEDDNLSLINYSGNWTSEAGNYSGGSIHWASSSGDGLTCTYLTGSSHSLYLGTRGIDGGATISITVDGVPVGGQNITINGVASIGENLNIPGEDVLMRVLLGNFSAGTHTVTVNSFGGLLYFDFLEIAQPTNILRQPRGSTLSLATDWDTEHSLCLAPERTAWMIGSLGFHGRVNHYAGALWFYQIVQSGNQYASETVTFSGTPVFGAGQATQLTIGTAGNSSANTVLTHVHLLGDTAETVAKAFELLLNNGFMSVMAASQGSQLTIYSRTLGSAGNNVTIAATTTCSSFSAQASGNSLTGGTDGQWLTDLQSTPRLNRAARDWTQAFFSELQAQGLNGTAAFSMELQFGDSSLEAGIVQRCPAGDPVLLPTPSVQTNFSPVSAAFWQEAYAELAQLIQNAGGQPYLQFGEVQWWYFPNDGAGRTFSGMPYYDDYTKSAFLAAYGREIGTIANNTVSLADYADEAAFLPTLVGNFTNQIIGYVQNLVPGCRFEVLYPVDVNQTELNRAVNYPAPEWSPANLACLKTENFGFTYARNLDQCEQSIDFPASLGFPAGQSAHLTGISYPTTPWGKEVQMAIGHHLESVVLFALDQFCLIGYPLELSLPSRRSRFQG